MKKVILTLILIVGIMTPVKRISSIGFTSTLLVEKEAFLEGVPANILKGICYTESKFKIKALNKFDAGSPSYGLCQIKYGTAKAMGFKGTRKELMSAQVNMKYAAKYLRYQIDRYNGDIRKAVLAYNAGSYKAKVKTKKYEIAYNESYYKKVLKGSMVDTNNIF